MTRWLAALRRPWMRGGAIAVAWAALALWLAVLLVAAVHLEGWQAQVTRTLLQLRADEQFRQRAGHREQLDPEWYRRKAVALLAALESTRGGGWWTLAMPGSWRVVDDLEERVAARIEREFGEIVVETLRRELLARAAALTGAPLSVGAPAAGRGCTPPSARGGGPAGGPVEELAEFSALRELVRGLQPLDQAVLAWRRLQDGRPADAAADLRHLVRYALDAELPGGMARSAAVFSAVQPAQHAQAVATVAAIQAAARCAFLRAAGALDARLLAENELLALEQALAERSAGVLDARRSEPLLPALKRLRAVHALLREQEAVLARGGTAWMRAEDLQFGPAYEALLAAAAAQPLLGPEVVQQARDQSQRAFTQFQRQFETLFARGRPALAWNEALGRFAIAPERIALRQGLEALLREPLLQVGADGLLPAAPPSFEAALRAPEERQRLRHLLARLPDGARPPLARLVDQRLALFSHDAAANAIRASVPEDLAAPFDAAAFRAQREQVARVQAVLHDLGAPDLAQRLASQQAAELSARLARAHEELQALPLFAHVTDFGWWRGEPGPLLKAMGVADGPALQHLLAQQYGRVDTIGRQAARFLEAADGALANDPAALRWQRLLAELDRYRAQLPDSSMLAMQRYLLGLGGSLRQDNCAEQLFAQAPPPHEDDVARRLTQMHLSLAQRCAQLRTPAGGDPVLSSR